MQSARMKTKCPLKSSVQPSNLISATPWFQLIQLSSAGVETLPMLEVEESVRWELLSPSVVAHCTVGSGMSWWNESTPHWLKVHFLWGRVIEMTLVELAEMDKQGKCFHVWCYYRAVYCWKAALLTWCHTSESLCISLIEGKTEAKTKTG